MKKTENNKVLIGNLTDAQFVNHHIPTTILVTKADTDFTIVEANEEYFKLIGYNKEEVWEVFQNRGYHTLHPEDRAEAIELMQFQLVHAKDKVFSVKCRLIHKEDGYHVAHFRGKVSKTEQGEELIYLLITDITEYMSTLQALEEEREFNNMIASFTENAFFDYNIETKTIRYSNEFAERLGIPSIITDYPKTVLQMGVIAKEDIEHVLTRFRSLSNNSDPQEDEIHLVTLSGEDLWYQYHYRVLYDEKGIAVRIVGRMTDVTKHRTEINDLSVKANYDPLTGLYNKGVTERIIKEYLKVSTNDMKHAFIIVDLDNFKQINDTFGHLYGDDVLKDVAKILRNALRHDDIIGRIGGDEFVVFMKNCKASENVYFKTREIGKALRRTYVKKNHAVSISASIGVAFFVDHATTFEGLYECADHALYQVKNSGRDSVSFYHRNE